MTMFDMYLADSRRIIAAGLEKNGFLPATAEAFAELDEKLGGNELFAARAVGIFLARATHDPEHDEPLTPAEIEELSFVAKKVREYAASLVHELDKEHGAALVALAKPHPLLGKKVTRKYRTYSGGAWQNQHGVLKQNTNTQAMSSYSFRGAPSVWSCKPGEFYVRTAGGTNYDMAVNANRTEWVAVPVKVTQRLLKLVTDALARAAANGHGFEGVSDEQVAIDMATCDADLERAPLDVLEAAVKLARAS